MQSFLRRFHVGIVATLLLVTVGNRAWGLSHLWKINEIFSNEDRSVQFIELLECCGSTSENLVRGLEVTSQTTGKIAVFPENLAGSTANKFLLLATPAFAALPGVPEPDLIIPSGFFSSGNDLLWYAEARDYDSFGWASQLPSDGVTAVHITDHIDDVFELGVNSPTNFAGDSTTIDVSEPEFVRGDCNVDEQRDVSDALFFLRFLFVDSRPTQCRDACDSNDDGRLDVSDAVTLLLALFVAPERLPEPLVCGEDSTDDVLSCSSFPPCGEPGQ